ncbi:hypothetical protein NFI96_015567 [Prochilodus magdalenae]|nr:hypothetical protein NFI96_015567 [Prochilodus magdalenae]
MTHGGHHCSLGVLEVESLARLTASNLPTTFRARGRRGNSFPVVFQKEEALKQRKEVSLQLRSLREELTHSVSCCERLQKEKEEVCVALEAAVLKLQEQHQAELTQLEETLRDFYSAEWDKTHQAYQEEADKYRALMQKQVEEMRRKQEALRKEQEVAHVQEMEALRQEYEASLAVSFYSILSLFISECRGVCEAGP